MRKRILAMSLMPVVVLFLSCCGLQPDSIVVTNAEQTPMPVSYAIEGDTIVKVQGDRNAVIYNVTEQFPDDWDCWLDNLVILPKSLVFTEGGLPRDADEYRYALVRIAFDGSSRVELDAFGGDYVQILPYDSRVYFVLDCMKDLEIGWANIDGSGSGSVDVPVYATEDGREQYIEKATLYIESDQLYADIGLSDLNFNGFSMEYTVRINDDLSVERIDG